MVVPAQRGEGRGGGAMEEGGGEEGGGEGGGGEREPPLMRSKDERAVEKVVVMGTVCWCVSY